MASEKHIIQQFSFEMQTQNAAQSHAIRRQCVRLVKEKMANEMDEILSAYFSGDTITRIDKIEINLGDIAAENLEKDFVANCMAGLANKISSMMAGQKPSVESEITQVEKQENLLEQFFYFLSSGKMPWAAHEINFQQWQTEIIEATKLKEGVFRKEFSIFLAQNLQAVERLAMQFDDESITALVGLCQPALRNQFFHLTSLLNEAAPRNENPAFRTEILFTLLPWLFGCSKKADTNDALRLLELISGQHQDTDHEKIFSSLKETIVAIAEKPGNDFIAAPSITQPEEKIKGGDAKDKSVYIGNAGIIILHPFLKNLFNAAGLMQTESFNNVFSKQKAAHLLQYLANGQLQLPEYTMPLNKILCGLPIEEPIDRFIQIADADLNEADELLLAAITHWAALKNTSVATLQETFLQRNGKLRFNETDGYWQLLVERKAVDILLDKLPWGFAFIKLPWMIFPLHVEW